MDGPDDGFASALKSLNSEQLVLKTKALVHDEQRITSEVIEHLREIDARRLYAERGYSSLYEFCLEELGYSEGAAYRRIAAMRLLRDVPEAKAALLAGEISLTNAATLNGFFYSEKKNRHKFYTKKEKLELLGQLKGKSKNETETLLRAISPRAVPQERERRLTPTETELRIVLNERVMKKLRRIKELTAHQNPDPTYAELIEKMADALLKKIELAPADADAPEKASSLENASPPEMAKSTFAAKATRATPGFATRFIPTPLRRAVWQRDRGRCTYRDPKTGRQCESRRAIEIDHIKPFSMGGGTTYGNLRLLCATHNQLAAIQAFGAKKVLGFVRSEEAPPQAP